MFYYYCTPIGVGKESQIRINQKTILLASICARSVNSNSRHIIQIRRSIRCPYVYGLASTKSIVKEGVSYPKPVTVKSQPCACDVSKSKRNIILLAKQVLLREGWSLKRLMQLLCLLSMGFGSKILAEIQLIVCFKGIRAQMSVSIKTTDVQMYSSRSTIIKSKVGELTLATRELTCS